MPVVVLGARALGQSGRRAVELGEAVRRHNRVLQIGVGRVDARIENRGRDSLAGEPVHGLDLVAADRRRSHHQVSAPSTVALDVRDVRVTREAGERVPRETAGKSGT